MAGALSKRRRAEDAPYWPGFVDAMAQLLLVITFLLSVFMTAQFLLAREMSGQDSALGQLRSQIAELTQLLALEKSAKGAVEANLLALSDDLSAERQKNAGLLANLAAEGSKGSAANQTISGLQTALDKEKALTSEALSQVELLNQQIAAMRRQLAQLNSILTDAETRNKSSEAQIADLGKRLNSALAQRVQELSRYRSEFFGRLRQILSQRSDILVVGDRFVFQSEVLFAKGDAEISPLGQEEMLKLADALRQLEAEIPQDIAWVLRVDGHTDIDPIKSPFFQSNWELSSARAIAVVKFLIAQGIAPKHLVAAGFGEFQPLDVGTSEDAKSQNRRIELKLTER
ncbi:MAG TPA: peptidoglycan -binding protein [Aestuariivirga sp.]|jgi:chemotaxis protein MotB|nr:peptidoglycan -binding protein [Hyphomicrobiales bacterium]MCC7482174.1 peptidoglycan -binding protein [Hyphomicrobiales bacterium]HQY73290.1 peptidoglycan -binding protein [Aestuariivirga sp.]HRA94616.1 peptidoglycan -binding protein [Aestuariivirga sp.]